MRIFLLSLLLFVIGCKKSSEQPCTKEVAADVIAAVDQDQLSKDITAIDDYLAKNSIVAAKDPSGLRYVISTSGDDSRPCLESKVSVRYDGKLLTNGNVFDSSVNPVSFELKNLILGWQIAFLNFGKGTKATIYIPSGFAYGKSTVSSIPANSNLIFYIELIGF